MSYACLLYMYTVKPKLCHSVSVYCIWSSVFTVLHCSNGLIVSAQTVTEKHKLNVPETMTEVLDVSDEEGEFAPHSSHKTAHFPHF